MFRSWRTAAVTGALLATAGGCSTSRPLFSRLRGEPAPSFAGGPVNGAPISEGPVFTEGPAFGAPAPAGAVVVPTPGPPVAPPPGTVFPPAATPPLNPPPVGPPPRVVPATPPTNPTKNTT